MVAEGDDPMIGFQVVGKTWCSGHASRAIGGPSVPGTIKVGGQPETLCIEIVNVPAKFPSPVQVHYPVEKVC